MTAETKHFTDLRRSGQNIRHGFNLGFHRRQLGRLHKLEYDRLLLRHEANSCRAGTRLLSWLLHHFVRQLEATQLPLMILDKLRLLMVRFTNVGALALAATAAAATITSYGRDGVDKLRRLSGCWLA